MTDTNHGKDNAQAFLNNIVAMWEEWDGADEERQEEIREEMEQEALSVEVRSSWQSVGEEMEADEYRILLTYGGPSLQIVGDLDQYKQPSSFKVQYQDWFKPWENMGLGVDEEKAVEWFLSFYWFGE